MPKSRLPKELWYMVRIKVWERDNHKCVHCNNELTLEECHIDHIRSGKLGDNRMSNLRTLCRKCHVLRYDYRHRGMISNALKNGIIPSNWREFVWED